MKKIMFISVFIIVLISGQAVFAQTESRKDNQSPAPEQKEDRITAKELKRMMDQKKDILIIDARAGNSYLGSSVRIKGAVHITLDELESRMDELPKDKEIVIYCT